MLACVARECGRTNSAVLNPDVRRGVPNGAPGRAHWYLQYAHLSR